MDSSNVLGSSLVVNLVSVIPEAENVLSLGTGVPGMLKKIWQDWDSLDNGFQMPPTTSKGLEW